jgi:hypothetical protein
MVRDNPRVSTLRPAFEPCTTFHEILISIDRAGSAAGDLAHSQDGRARSPIASG